VLNLVIWVVSVDTIPLMFLTQENKEVELNRVREKRNLLITEKKGIQNNILSYCLSQSKILFRKLVLIKACTVNPKAMF